MDAVKNTHSFLVFAQTTVIMEMNPYMEETFVKLKLFVNKFSSLKVTVVKCCSFGESCNFCFVTDCTWLLVDFFRPVSLLNHIGFDDNTLLS